MSEQNSKAQFERQNYLNLETFRKSGVGVKTPVWFVEDQGKFYVRTIAGSGKVKRLRRNPQVRVAPCAANGELKGSWTEAEAREVTDNEAMKRVNDLLNRKYGLTKRMFDLMQFINKSQPTAIEIEIKQ